MNKNRITTFLMDFDKQWKKVPFMSFGQLMENLSAFVKTKYNKDLFSLGDTELMCMLKEFLQHCR